MMRVAEEHAEEYCKDGRYDDYPNPSLADSIDIWDDIKAAYTAGFEKGYNYAREKTTSGDEEDFVSQLAYLVEEPEKQVLDCTKLKVGDILRNGTGDYMVVAINKASVTCNVCLGGKGWVFNSMLEDDFELVTEETK